LFVPKCIPLNPVLVMFLLLVMFLRVL